MKFAARQASDGPAPATHAAYDVGGLGGSPDEQARVAVRHQGDGPGRPDLPESVTRLATRSQMRDHRRSPAAT